MKTLLTFAAAGVVCGAGVAFAQPDVVSEHPTVIEVPYGDVDLSQPEDRDELLRRIMFSASNACGGAPDSMLDLQAWSYYRACRNAAVDGAVGQIQPR